MASGQQILSKVNKTLRKLNASGRVVMWRTTTVTGGHPVLGGGTATHVDVVADPQPVVDSLPTETIVSSGNLYQLGDFKMTFPGDIPEEYFQTKTLRYGDQTLKIIRRDPVAVYGTIVLWEVIARAVPV